MKAEGAHWQGDSYVAAVVAEEQAADAGARDQSVNLRNRNNLETHRMPGPEEPFAALLRRPYLWARRTCGHGLTSALATRPVRLSAP